jgi:hypothetical protein
MPTLKLPAVMANASQHYRAQLNGQVGVGEGRGRDLFIIQARSRLSGGVDLYR